MKRLKNSWNRTSKGNIEQHTIAATSSHRLYSTYSFSAGEGNQYRCRMASMQVSYGFLQTFLFIGRCACGLILSIFRADGEISACHTKSY